MPYQSTVETDSWTDRKDKSIRIEQTIFVERESQRKIVLGKGGATIRERLDFAFRRALSRPVTDEETARNTCAKWPWICWPTTPDCTATGWKRSFAMYA